MEKSPNVPNHQPVTWLTWCLVDIIIYYPCWFKVYCWIMSDPCWFRLHPIILLAKFPLGADWKITNSMGNPHCDRAFSRHVCENVAGCVMVFTQGPHTAIIRPSEGHHLGQLWYFTNLNWGHKRGWFPQQKPWFPGFGRDGFGRFMKFTYKHHSAWQLGGSQNSGMSIIMWV